jgi:maltooligosyltrehalose trehalohydrolase
MGESVARTMVAAYAQGRRYLTARFAHSMPFGATLLREGGTRFRLWAPSSPVVDLELQIRQDLALCRMDRVDGGWHELVVAEAGAGTQYRFRVLATDARSLWVPDPASRHNSDVHGKSTVVDPQSYAWANQNWRGRAWADLVLYELHVGTFTPQGTFTAAVEQLPDLAALGITALQLMPVAAFPGNRNWGYDGVLPFAPAAVYGSPDDLKSLVDAAHSLGLVVLLDVVYNHFGPEGNYLYAYCPEFFNSAHQTPWGAAVNFDTEGSRTVRDFFVHNALFWVEEYQFDGLRLDAVHAMRDTSESHIVCEISAALRFGPGQSRPVHVALENNANQARYLMRNSSGEPKYATAQWDDDVHHALHVVTTGEIDGYYADYSAEPVHRLGRSLADGFAYQGEYSAYRRKARGEPSGELPPSAFVSFLQNHDMVGNRAFGGRIHEIADPHLQPTAYVCLLLCPQVPMLFMGEEFAASTPFLYFCDFGKDLAQSVSDGRRREFSRFAAFATESQRALIPDPSAASSFSHSQLRWAERDQPVHRERMALIGELLVLRRQYLAPLLGRITHGGEFAAEGRLLRVQWWLDDGSLWQVLAYFGSAAICTRAQLQGDVIYSSRVQELSAGQSRFEPGASEVRLWQPPSEGGAHR